MSKKQFSVHSYTVVPKDAPLIHSGHWSDGLTVVIQKDGKEMRLQGDEIRKLVNTLPRTFGGQHQD